jgi:hypothetical protein
MNFILPAWAKYAALALIALALYGMGRMDGSRIEGAKHLAYVAKQATATVRIARAQEKVVVQTEIKYRDRIRIIKEKGETIVKEVPVFVTAADDAAVTVPIGFVRIHRAATTGEPAGAPVDSDREASGIALSTVAEVDAYNGKNHRTCIAQVEGWQEFYSNLQTATHH